MKTFEEAREEFLQQNYHYADTRQAARDGFDAGKSYADKQHEALIDDKEAFEKDLQWYCNMYGTGSPHIKHFTEGWKMCRNYKFQLMMEKIHTHLELLTKVEGLLLECSDDCNDNMFRIEHAITAIKEFREKNK